MSNRKFASIIFLLLTIIISLALSGVTLLINDKKNISLPILSESFEGYNLDETNHSMNMSDANQEISVAGGPVYNHVEKGKLGDKIVMKCMAVPDEHVEEHHLEENRVIDHHPKHGAASKPDNPTIFERIFGFTNAESFSLRY